MDILNVRPGQLRQAADLQERIQSLQSELNQLLDGASTAQGGASIGAGGRRKMSAAGRARIAAAAKARWAKYRTRTGASTAGMPSKPKRKMSAAAKKRLAEIARARWAKVKRAGKSRL